MRVLQVLPTLSAGGAEGFVTNLGVSLAKLQVDVRFFLLAGATGERGQVLITRLRDAGIVVVGAEEHNVRSPLNVIHLVRQIRSWRPDIVQANLHAAEVVTAVGRLFSLGSSTCCIHRVANTDFIGSRSPTVVKLLDRFFSTTIACSDSVASNYRAFIKGDDDSKVTTIVNGGIFPEYIPSAEDKVKARRRLKIPEQAFVVAHIGRMFPGDRVDRGIGKSQKAHDVLLKAFAEAFEGNRGIMMAMVGDGPLRPEIEGLAKSLGIKDVTLFLGQQPEPWSVLEAADVFFFPSRFEGLPNALLEAAASGLPIVASSIPEISDLCLSNTWMLEPVDDVKAFASALRQIYDKRSNYSAKAQAIALQFSSQYSMESCARQYLKAYKTTLAFGRE